MCGIDRQNWIYRSVPGFLEYRPSSEIKVLNSLYVCVCELASRLIAEMDRKEY